MDYTAIHIYGHLLSDDILHSIETDRALAGNRDIDFGLDSSVQERIDYAWTTLRSAWKFYQSRSLLSDPYGTRRSREFVDTMLRLFDYQLLRQTSYVTTDTGLSYQITWLCPDLKDFPVIAKGEGVEDSENERCSLDFRSKGGHREKSAHATMLEYLNNTDNIYGIIANGPTIRLIRNAGQLVKQTYIEFDIRKMLEEDKYAEFALMFRVLHASRFNAIGDNPSIIEQWFNQSIESGNRIRDGLSRAAQRAMEIIGNAAVHNDGKGNEVLRNAISSGTLSAATLNKELMHLLYRILFLFIIEDRGLVFDGDDDETNRFREIYKQFYSASRFRSLSELGYVRDSRYSDMWLSLLETFRLFEDEDFGARLGIKPLGGILFNPDTLHWLKECTISNDALFDAFRALNVFEDERGQLVRINYSSLDVEEFGSVYEGILEMRPTVVQGSSPNSWAFEYVGGLDRQSTSSYYTRPDLVQNLIRTTLEPVINERINKCSTPEEKVESLLSMKVCDAASGSGHIVLAMARTIAWYVCSIRIGEDNPASQDYRRALHEVIERCVYAVDFNPDAVELCKVVLWIEGYCSGKPLSFLDHHIRCGNSVVGITDLQTLLDGVPDKAFSSDSREVLRDIKALNRQAIADARRLRERTSGGWVATSLYGGEYNITLIEQEQVGLAAQVQQINELPEDSLLEQLTKKRQWEELMVSPRVESLRRACDIFVDAFYHNFKEEDLTAIDVDGVPCSPNFPYTGTVYQALQEIKELTHPDSQYVPLTPEFKRHIADVASEHRFFHWCVEFPEVFVEGGGFDVICGNPPWDKIKVEDKKWFESHGRMDIVNAGTASQRKKAIENLAISDTNLYEEYLGALADAEAMSRFVRFSGRFPLTATGDIDLYPMFAELCMQFSREAWGLVLPTGIAVNDSNKEFFSKLIDENRLISLYDFENREKLFDIHRMFKFCLLTAGEKQAKPRDVMAGFYLTRLDHLLDPNRIYTLQTSDFALLNPNTKTCPIFRTSRDAELTAKIYRKCGHIIENEHTGDNPWGVKFGRMFDMSNDSYLFRTFAQLVAEGAALSGNRFTLPDDTVYVPLYEGKMIWLFDHHYGTWPTSGERPNTIDSPSLKKLQDPSSCIMPWYWVPATEVAAKTSNYKESKGGLMIYRGLTNATNERTFILATVPNAFGVGNSATAFGCGTVPGLVVQGLMSSLPFDYVVRQKVGGTNMSTYFVKQFPIFAPEQISDEIKWEIAKRVIELNYFNHDMDDWAAEIWKELTTEQKAEFPGLKAKEPFIFDPERRAVLQAELDAIVAHLYGLTTEELRYILDPEDICGEGCINQTFRVLKEREIREYGEYRTRRLVLEVWEQFGYSSAPHL